MNFNLAFQPFVSWPLWWVAVAIGAAIAAYHLYARRRGSVFRLLAFLLLALALANPIISQDQRERLKDLAVVVVDRTPSQGVGDRQKQTDAALAEVSKRIAALGQEVRVVDVRASNSEELPGSRLFEALDQARSDISPERYSGAVLITDGQVHDVPQAFSDADASAPVHSLITGSRKEIDRRIVIERAPKFAITDQEQLMAFKVEQNEGLPPGVKVTVTLPNGETQNLDVIANQTVEVPFTLPHAGKNLFELRAEVLPGEISPLNNRAIFSIDGVRDRLRVLLVSGEPHPGERTWRNLLKADAAVDLVHFTILRPPEKQDGTPTRELSLIAFPTRELFLDKIDEFDLVIFDRYRRQAILPEEYLANVAAYVRRGGAVLLASGPDYAAIDGLYSSPLSDILVAAPTGEVTEKAFRPAVTDAGRRHPVTSKLPGGEGAQATWGHWFRIVDAAVTGDAKPLLTGPDQKPLMMLQRVGEGRVAQILSDHGWLWARGYDGGGPQVELLRRTAHWLMKEPDLEEEALLARQIGTQLRIERRTMGDTAASVKVTSPSGKDVTVPLAAQEPGLFAAQVDVAEAGLFVLDDGTMRATAAIGNADPKEMRDLKATADILAPVAKATRGGSYWLEDGMPRISLAADGSATAGAGWMGLKDNQRYRVTAVRETALFSTLASLAALLLLIPALWYREGR
jgi:hypothetical protein